jgi:NitT/TauT family transport system substrate-binding protein
MVIQLFGSGRYSMPIQSRRRFLTNAAFAGAAGLGGVGAWGKSQEAEPPPEITTIRLSKFLAICFAPQYVCEELLRDEGFTDVRYGNISMQEQIDDSMLGGGRVDFASSLTLGHILAIDAGAPITIVSPVHGGCYELFAHDNVRSIGDLRGKSVGGVAVKGLISILTAWVGIDPEKDLTVVEDPDAKPLEQFVQGKLDAYLGFPPEPQELRARKVGHVILRTAVDPPWSQYYCCTLAGNREFVRKHPVATKRVIRALLKAADLCASQPERSARLLVKDGFVPRYDYALETLREVPYGLWREYDAEDTVRFWALRAYQLGFVKSIPQKMIAEGTDFRSFDELKRELKA